MNGADETIGVSLARGLGDAPAILCGDRTLSYAGLDVLACRFGNAYHTAGIGTGDRIVFVLNDTPELIAAYLGALKIGAVPVAFSTRASAADLNYVVENSECRLLMIEPDRAADVNDGCQTVTNPVTFAAGGAADLVSEPLSPDDPAFWFYTSGTTGRPKAVVHLLRMIPITGLHLKENLGVAPGDRLFTTSKMFFAFALCHSFLGALRLGATMVLHKEWPDAQHIAAVVDRYQPNIFLSVPTLYRNLLSGGLAAGEGFRAVRHFVSAGEKLPAALLEDWRAATGSSILEGIGTSETACLFIANTPGDVCPGSTGRPLPWAQVRLVDDDGETVTTPNTLGHVQLRMESLFGEYWGRPEQTEAAFRDGWNQTGDMFTFDEDGRWYHQARADDMMKISGQWVSPSEIEDCALGCSAVSDAAAVEMTGDDGLGQVLLFVVSAAGDAPGANVTERVRAVLLAELPGYKQPRKISVIDAIPRTATGKAQRFRLREKLR